MGSCQKRAVINLLLLLYHTLLLLLLQQHRRDRSDQVAPKAILLVPVVDFIHQFLTVIEIHDRFPDGFIAPESDRVAGEASENGAREADR